ncbi:hypothetical protein VPNG_00208 [Cytospora leucostoma]|uniref:Uncharacterized protein n=1 Tax=Cytospora leucostoma TaxID=1230097 RepID=A0A423XNR8_9PEZI|nr:hypothetical protein VPNG_00208 [Cytospora leucostoma]
MASTIRNPDIRNILTPLLPALPAASLSTQPAPAILPLLSPILRQRVQLLSSASKEPWLRLLSYDKEKEARLAGVARSDRLEPHPVSGEVEVDWDYDVQTRYKRLDEETLQALLVLEDFGLFFRLVYCVNDEAGGGDGWRVGEISVPDKTGTLTLFAGYPTIQEAEKSFQDAKSGSKQPVAQSNGLSSQTDKKAEDEEAEEDDDDDDYWGRYDATPGRSPAPDSLQQRTQTATNHEDEDAAYFAQYDDVQPAMDNHDPDEAAVAREVMGSAAPPPLGLSRGNSSSSSNYNNNNNNNNNNTADQTNSTWTIQPPSPTARSHEEEERTAALLHPRPASSASSNGSGTVLKLEAQAGRQEQGQFAVKQHVSRSIRSLFLLSRAAGIDREEFDMLVKTELDVLGMVEDDI